MTNSKRVSVALNILAVAVMLLCGHQAMADSLLVAGVDAQYGSIGAFNATTGASEGVFATGSQTQNPYTFLGAAMATASNGDILITSSNLSNTGTINRYSPNGTQLGVFASLATNISGLATAPNGTVYAAAGQSIEAFNGTTGALEGTVVGSTSYYISDIAVAPDGNLLVDEYYSMATYSPSGTLLGSEGLPASPSFGIYVDSSGKVYVDTASHYIYNGTGSIYECTTCETGSGTLSLFGADPNSGDLGGMIAGPNGTILVASRFSSDVLQFNGTTGAYMGIFANTAATAAGADGLEYTTSDGPFVGAAYGSTPPTQGTPEPGTLMTLGIGMVGLARRLRQRKA